MVQIYNNNNSYKHHEVIETSWDIACSWSIILPVTNCLLHQINSTKECLQVNQWKQHYHLMCHCHLLLWWQTQLLWVSAITSSLQTLLPTKSSIFATEISNDSTSVCYSIKSTSNSRRNELIVCNWMSQCFYKHLSFNQLYKEF